MFKKMFRYIYLMVLFLFDIIYGFIKFVLSFFNNKINKSKNNFNNNNDFDNNDFDNNDLDNNDKILGNDYNNVCENDKTFLEKFKDKCFIADENQDNFTFKSNNEINNEDTQDGDEQGVDFKNLKGTVIDFLNQDLLKQLNLRFVIPLMSIFIISIFMILNFLFTIEIALIFLITIVSLFFIVLYFPKIQKGKKDSNVSRELPYALRQMVTELKSGKGL
ncbi:MAG: hypothetical protein LBR24_01110, partial [Methanobrevibacter sp.]|nr:hypothetical protein [Methanobrevibacter sp.]